MEMTRLATKIPTLIPQINSCQLCPAVLHQLVGQSCSYLAVPSQMLHCRHTLICMGWYIVCADHLHTGSAELI